ncbi:hypothetical protein BRC83_04925 [Halobacteriales archaeon QS_1_68_17]|nr:MAG: hypothetical protein BRC83_04925 [Halobacteriales archaeon QS_1_68_17]
METEGLLSPATEREAREHYEALGPAAQVLVREVARAMEFDREEYDRRVTSGVVETARDVLFASLLSVRVGTREEFEEWCADNPDYERREAGSEHVDYVVWHAAPAAEVVAAATFQDERDAAVGTLRRQAFGRVYRGIVTE